jgi:hypothetical protein
VDTNTGAADWCAGGSGAHGIAPAGAVGGAAGVGDGVGDRKTLRGWQATADQNGGRDDNGGGGDQKEGHAAIAPRSQ